VLEKLLGRNLMNRIYAVANWTFGVLCLLVALVALLSGAALPALPLLAISLLLLPPARSFAYSRTNKVVKPLVRVAGVALLIGVFGVVVGVTEARKKQALPDAKPQAPVLTEAQQAELEKQRIATERRQRIESQFSKWDGSHPGVEKAIKKSMHNPASYEHVETRFADRDDHLAIITKFRGTNEFGGVVMNSAKAKVDLEGNVLSLQAN
jgi:hypothetical protein